MSDGRKVSSCCYNGSSSSKSSSSSISKSSSGAVAISDHAAHFLRARGLAVPRDAASVRRVVAALVDDLEQIRAGEPTGLTRGQRLLQMEADAKEERLVELEKEVNELRERREIMEHEHSRVQPGGATADAALAEGLQMFSEFQHAIEQEKPEYVSEEMPT
ncbi:unnamed protein product [Phaeothamnion confervicola]